MPAKKNTTSNPFEVLNLDVEISSPKMHNNTGTTVSSKRQQKKFAKAEKAKADLAKQQAVAAAAAPSSKTAIEAIADKPQGWKATLTMAQVKALNAEEKAKENAVFRPPKTEKTSGQAAQANRKAK